MSIKYCVLLDNHSDYSNVVIDNFRISNATKEIIADISREMINERCNIKRIFVDGDFYYGFCKISPIYNFICITTNEITKRLIVDYLGDTHDTINKIIEMDKKFNKKICYKMMKEKTDFYNDPKNDKLQMVRTKVDDIRQIMMENLEDVMKRGETIDEIINVTSAMEDASQGFITNAKDIKRRLWWKSCRNGCFLFFAIIILATICLLIACDPNFDKCKKK